MSRHTRGDGQVSRTERHELSMTPRQLGGLVPSPRDCTFDPSFGIGWREVLSRLGSWLHPWPHFNREHGLPNGLEGQTVVGIQLGFPITS